MQKLKQHMLTNKREYGPSGYNIGGTMSSLLDAELNSSGSILEKEEHMT